MNWEGLLTFLGLIVVMPALICIAGLLLAWTFITIERMFK